MPTSSAIIKFLAILSVALTVSTDASSSSSNSMTTLRFFDGFLGNFILPSIALAGALYAELSPYFISFVFWLYLVAPHPLAFRKTNVDLKKAKGASWKSVDWKSQVLKRAPATGMSYAIIGAGFVGKKLIHTLLLRGETKIKAFDFDPHSCDSFEGDERVQFTRGDVTKYDQVLDFIRGADVVYTTFALIRYMDRLESQKPLSFRVNVGGTENVLKACKEAGVKALIYTSTSNVNVAPGQLSLHMDETVPYVDERNAPNWYGLSKAIAENLVLRADGDGGLRTVAVRPCSAVFGAGDKIFLDTQLKLGYTPMLNSGNQVIDFIPVLNVVWGLILTERALLDRADQGIGGNAFCVSNDSPMRMIDFLETVNVMRPGGMKRLPLPYRMMVIIACSVEFLVLLGFKVTGPIANLTSVTIQFLKLSYAFSSKKARERIGYEPLYSVEQGLQHAIDEYLQKKMLPELPNE